MYLRRIDIHSRGATIEKIDLPSIILEGLSQRGIYRFFSFNSRLCLDMVSDTRQSTPRFLQIQPLNNMCKILHAFPFTVKLIN